MSGILHNNIETDAIADPPRFEKNESKSADPILIKEQTSDNKPSPKQPPVDGNSTSTPKSEDVKNNSSKSTKTKKKSRSSQKTSSTTYHFYKCNGFNMTNSVTNVYNPKLNLNANGSSNCFSETHTPHNQYYESHKMSCDIEDLCNEQSKITTRDMILLKKYIGGGWKDVAINIGLTKGQIDQFLNDHSQKGLGEVFYKILLEWQESEDEEARIGVLAKAMWSAKEYDCLKKWAAFHKMK